MHLHTLTRTISAAAIAAAGMLEMMTPVSGEGSYPIDVNSIHVTKSLQSNELTALDSTFQFKAEAVTEDAPGALVAPIAISRGIDAVDSTGTGAITFGIFPHAGVYDYVLSETAGAAEVEHGTMLYDANTYQLKVLVTNTADGPAVKEIHVADNSDLSKVDENSIIFTNRYSRTGGGTIEGGHGLTVRHEVTGEYGDKTRKFEYQISFHKPANSLMPDGSEYDPARIAVTLPDSQTLQLDAEGNGTFYLTDTQEAYFDNLTCGASYDIKVVGVPGYTSSGVCTEDKTSHDADAVGTGNGSSFTASRITQGLNTAVFSHSASAIEVTGLSLDSVPFVFMILMALAVIVIGARINHQRSLR